MANTYCQLYVHVIFAVKYRGGFIGESWQQELYRYMTGSAEAHGHKVYAIGGAKDHVHILVGMSPTQSVSDMVRDLKRASAMWIKERHLVDGNFAWQEGYGAFTYGKSQISNVIGYIQNQKQHHIGKTMQEEYKEFLSIFGIEFDERYVFSEPN